jgi:uncharacterized cupredoxin-like copper-binding protein
MKKFVARMIVILAISLVLAACSGIGASGPSTTLKVEMAEFMFDPKALSVPAGKEITLELKNSGVIQHDFIILKKGVILPGKFDSEKQIADVYFHAALEPGKAGTFKFTAPAEAGEYQVICGIPGHFQSGMTAILTVIGQ